MLVTRGGSATRVEQSGGCVPSGGARVLKYAAKKSQLQMRYIAWAASAFISEAPVAADTFVINTSCGTGS